jgi:hypothetical protein
MQSGSITTGGPKPPVVNGKCSRKLGNRFERFLLAKPVKIEIQDLR